MQRKNVLVAAATAVVQAAGCTMVARMDGSGLDVVAYALLVASAVPLLWRDRGPGLVLVATIVPMIVYFALGNEGPAFLAMAVGMVSAVWRGERRWAWLLGAAGLAAYVAVELVLGTDTVLSAGFLGGHVGWLLVVLLGAEFGRARRERQAEQWRQHLEEQRRRASDERLAIARELHDVVAHSISVINVQAGIALHLRSDVDRAFDTLGTIRQVSAEALGELKQTLGVLRGDTDPPRLPAPDMRAFDDLAAQAESSGLDVELARSGLLAADPPARLPSTVAHAAYRVVQEAVTNAIRHSGSSSVRIELDWSGDRLDLAVLDRGSGVDVAPVAGNGMRGMRERVQVLGGELSVGPRAGGGCAVRAWVPATRTGTDDDREADVGAGGAGRAGGRQGSGVDGDGRVR